MSKLKLGIFYACDNNLESQISRLKKLYLSKNINNKYLNHPVHMTFYVLEINKNHLNEFLFKFESLKTKINPIDSKINGITIFENDILTGYNTLTIEVKSSKHLKEIQMAIVHNLHNYNVHSIRDTSLQGDFLKSHHLWGYPFVGDPWIPHITIGSLDLDTESLKNDAEQYFTLPNQIKINNLCLYKIEGDYHELIHKITL